MRRGGPSPIIKCYLSEALWVIGEYGTHNAHLAIVALSSSSSNVKKKKKGYKESWIPSKRKNYTSYNFKNYIKMAA